MTAAAPGAIALPARIDLRAVRPLAADLVALAGAPLRIDAAAVGHLGALGLQLLLAAARDWRAAGHRLSVEPRSPAFDAALADFGVGLDEIQSRGTA